MPDRQKDIPAAGAKRHKTERPLKPPADLWEKLDKLYTEMQPPADAKSTLQMAEHYGLPRSDMRHLIEKMVRAGKLEFVGKFNGQNYYRAG